jgi:hypothetical protein
MVQKIFLYYKARDNAKVILSMGLAEARKVSDILYLYFYFASFI